MKKTIFIALMMLLGVASAFAQRPDANASAEERAERTVTALSEKIEVTDDQKVELTAIFTTFYEDIVANRGDRSAMRELVSTRDEQVKLILDDEAKYEAYTEMLAERRKRARGRKRGGNRN